MSGGCIQSEKQKPQNVCPTCGVRSERWEHLTRDLFKCPQCGRVCACYQRKRLTPVERAEAEEAKKARKKAYDLATIDKRRQRDRERWQRNGAVLRARSRKAWANATPEQVEARKAKRHEYYVANKEAHNKRCAAWRAANPGKVYIYQKRYALKRLRALKESEAVDDAQPQV